MPAVGTYEGAALRAAGSDASRLCPTVGCSCQGFVDDSVPQSQDCLPTDSWQRRRRGIAAPDSVQPQHGCRGSRRVHGALDARELKRNATARAARPELDLRKAATPPIDVKASIMSVPTPSEGRQCRGSGSGLCRADESRSRRYGGEPEKPATHEGFCITPRRSRAGNRDALPARTRLRLTVHLPPASPRLRGRSKADTAICSYFALRSMISIL
jgi:hypothetical protein